MPNYNLNYTGAQVNEGIGKAMTALQEHQSLADYRTSAAQDLIDTAQSTSITNLQTAVGQNINQWDEMWENGYYEISTGVKRSDSRFVCSSNKIKVTPSTDIYLKAPVSMEVFGFDANGSFVQALSSSGANKVISIPSTVYYIAFNNASPSSITTYNHDISINYPSSFTGYYPSALPKANAHICGLGNVIGMRGWNQLAFNGDFAYGSGDDANGWSRTGALISVSSSGCTIKSNGTATYPRIQHQTVAFISGHKYYFTATGRVADQSWELNIRVNVAVFPTITGDTNYHTVSCIFVAGLSDYTINHVFNTLIKQTSGTVVGNLKNVMLIDLTALFGAGNEPTSVADFRAMFPADYYPYCSGSFGDLLWTNASPSSEFVEQDIYLDFSKYSKVGMVFSFNTTVPDRDEFVILEIGKWGETKQVNVTATGVHILNRRFYVDSTHAYILCGYDVSGSTYFASNDICIPQRIYGIR